MVSTSREPPSKTPVFMSISVPKNPKPKTLNLPPSDARAGLADRFAGIWKSNGSGIALGSLATRFLVLGLGRPLGY